MKRFFVFFLFLVSLAGQPVPGRYIVQLEGEPGLRPAMGASRAPTADPGFALRRAQLREQHRGLGESVAALGGRVARSFEVLVNAVVVTGVNPERLARLPGVRSVEPVERLQMHMDRAVGVHRATDAWAAIEGGKEAAGRGIKIAIIDSGIDAKHPAFIDESLTAPEGYPKVVDEAHKEFTNSKVIVARGYGGSPAPVDPHGTGVAMAAAGNFHDGPLGPLSGIAPKAFLGNYNVFHSGTTEDLILALEDAVLDGMDVINMSLGIPVLSQNTETNSISRAVNRAVEAGLVMVSSAGNSGPDRGTVSHPAILPTVIAAGASGSDRVFDLGLTLEGGAPFVIFPGDNTGLDDIITAKMADVAKVMEGSLGCDPLPAASLSGKIALIQRGACTFEAKINNAELAGAVAAVVFNNVDDLPVTMVMGTALLPAVFISQADGLEVRRRLEENADLSATLDLIGFTPFLVTSNRLAAFSSRGPSVSGTIKPDLTAVGTSVVTGWTTSEGPSWALVGGTSFSSPMIAGAAAILKGVRPGLTAPEYQSLLVNSAPAFTLAPDDHAALPLESGAGRLDVFNAVRSTLAASPVSLSFGSSTGTVDASREITFKNLSGEGDAFTVTVEPISGPAPEIDATGFDLEGGAKRTITAKVAASSLEPGVYQGFIKVAGSKNEVASRIPYWFGVTNGQPSAISVLRVVEFGYALEETPNAILFRVSDLTGTPMEPQSTPEVTTESVRASVIGIRPAGDIPGTYTVDVRLGRAGYNVFTVRIGDVTRDIEIYAENP